MAGLAAKISTALDKFECCQLPDQQMEAKLKELKDAFDVANDQYKQNQISVVINQLVSIKRHSQGAGHEKRIEELFLSLLNSNFEKPDQRATIADVIARLGEDDGIKSTAQLYEKCNTLDGQIFQFTPKIKNKKRLFCCMSA